MIYKDIKGYEGLYQISNTGKVRSLNYGRTGKSKILKGSYDKDGYLDVILYKNNKRTYPRIHRLVAIEFIPNINNKRTINHKNGIKDDNRVSNLEWMTHKENSNHAFKILGVKFSKERNENISNKLSKAILQYDLDGNFIKEYKSARTAANELNCNHQNIAFVVDKINRTSRGFKWKYKI